jgi:alanyl-tRNA synthetase
MTLSTPEIRNLFLTFFEERGHRVVPPAPLVPEDPTLLFNSAGMVQFKSYYQQTDDLPFTRAASLQPCLRVNDLEKVGRTLRHHTLFEMLGNFSFGDYFKRDAIVWAWEFMTRVAGVEEERLWVSVFREDDEAEDLWVKETGIPRGRIVRLDEKDNFWGPVGETGVCGPSSEIYYDTGEARSCGREDCTVGCDCDRYIEVWNLVFPQFMKREDGTFDPLSNPGIDTGMGLERMAFILQGAEDNYGTDAFRPLVDRVRVEAGLSGDPDEKEEFACKVAAEHARALTFPIAEGVFPSNEGRGYVLRRLLRRALTRLHMIGVEEPLLHRVTETVAEVMGGAYPHLLERRDHVAMVVRGEEERFLRTLHAGLEHLDGLLQAGAREGRVRGEDAFYLYDTMGFPLELTCELAEEKGLHVDREGFDRAMEEQRRQARGASRFHRAAGASEGPWTEVREGEGDRFEGYRELELDASVLRFRRGSPERLPPGFDPPRGGSLWEVVLDRTPFYPVGGGQEADQGTLSLDGRELRVIWVFRVEEGIVHLVHEDDPREGAPFGGDLGAKLCVDAERRAGLMRNHTATHLLHAALREVLGEHVVQAGSLVARNRLRFDFSHYEAPGEEQLRRIEAIVNRRMRDNLPVVPEVVPLEEARRRGAMALFGEKYGERVRMVRIGEVSLELCGGTHLERTGSASPFVIARETSAASGVRRIEAFTGPEAEEALFGARDRERHLAGALKVEPGRALDRLRDLEGEIGRLRGELRRARAGAGAARRLERTEVVGVTVAAGRVGCESVEEMREEADRLRGSLGSGAGLLVAEIDGKPIGMVVTTPDLPRDRGVGAPDLLRRVVAITGGGGGGRPLLAQGRIGDPDRVDRALESFPVMVEEALAGKGGGGEKSP